MPAITVATVKRIEIGEKAVGSFLCELQKEKQ
jgi:hypothetical protein